MMHKVQIVETITESREYDIEADTPELAAMTAHKQWIIDGKEPEDGRSLLRVDERSYVVDGAEVFVDGDD